MALELLALRGLGLGDLLTAVPALRSLRQAFPAHRITLAAPRYLEALLPLIGAVDDQVDVAGPGPIPMEALPFERPDVAVNLHGRGPQSIEALRATDPGRLISFGTGPPWQDGVHEVRRWCELLEWHGIPADPSDLTLGISDRTGPAIVHPGAAYPARRWPPERFAEVAAALDDVVITGNAEEVPIASRVAELAGLPPERMLAGRTRLADLIDLVSKAKLVVCGDTGVAHLATAFCVPSVVLFGPVSPKLWGPPPGWRHVALWAGQNGDPHGQRPDPGLLKIEVSEVVDAAMEVIS
ncbi:ADP-heptose--lipooligosaccharide heptosyltransferase II [[Actinomadura] parvosata subsp. kistnae]|uniref:Glycosyl transferase n=1 Tax=[Actinomadura] parvosata subsp. kistnae TaxID=1909395 RepID=A0A1U9ZT56_9ACTN|nr:glycosyltransferase family 9 protein [Nonomuraea sp. ATCC 55076]AQZ61135.1 glycosyl transferase [Nonomuraea sp. ATCC 55076]SPL87482.1 ADP-heptose--lipooligosaccharide heptosyltransferase II [Actinomadura parvosata subsp. kistnae]